MRVRDRVSEIFNAETQRRKETAPDSGVGWKNYNSQAIRPGSISSTWPLLSRANFLCVKISHTFFLTPPSLLTLLKRLIGIMHDLPDGFCAGCPSQMFVCFVRTRKMVHVEWRSKSKVDRGTFGKP